jgi:hypothetical protein
MFVVHITAVESNHDDEDGDVSDDEDYEELYEEYGVCTIQ